MISRVLTNDIIGLVKEIGGRSTKTPAVIVGVPFAFPLCAFPPHPLPPLLFRLPSRLPLGVRINRVPLTLRGKTRSGGLFSRDKRTNTLWKVLTDY